MPISIVRPDELGPSDIAAWQSMQRSTASLANPFLSPEFAITVSRFRPSARVAVITDGPATTGFFPFERRRLGVGVPIGAGLTDCQGLVHAPGVEWDLRELLRACRISAWQFDHLAQDQRPFERYRTAMAPSPVIDLNDGFDIYYKKLQQKSPQFCKDVARKARKLAREAGELRFVVDSRDTAALRALMTWKSDQYRRTGRMDRFSQPSIVGLVHDLFTTHESHFSSLFSVLYAGDVPVAAHFGLLSGDVLAHWFPAYDTRFSRYSPGLIQHLRMAEDIAGLGVRLIDMGKGAKRYKETLKSGDIFVSEGVAIGRSPLAVAHRARTAPSQWAVRKIRQHPSLFHVADLLLRRYGRASTALRRPRQTRHGHSQTDTRRAGTAGNAHPAGVTADGPDVGLWRSAMNSDEKAVMHLDEDMAAVTAHSGHVDILRLLLVDDHLMVTEALASRLSTAPDLWVAGRCATLDPNLIDIVRGLRPDVITIEAEPFGSDVGEVLRQLVAARPSAGIIVLSADRDVAHAVEAARAGVAAWVAKEQGAAELETVIRGVGRGHSWFPPDMLGEILRELRADVSRASDHTDPLDVLSPRERDVLLSMMDGKRGSQIAADLRISTDTVRTHTRNIFAKLDVHSRLEAVSMAHACRATGGGGAG